MVLKGPEDMRDSLTPVANRVEVKNCAVATSTMPTAAAAVRDARRVAGFIDRFLLWMGAYAE